MPPDHPSRREAGKERRRARILDVAARLFAERGVESVTLGDVARAAAVSRPLVYFYFKDRDELFQAAVERANERLYDRFVAAVASHGRGVDQMEAIGRAYRAFFAEDPHDFTLLACYNAKPGPAPRPGSLPAKIECHHREVMALMTAALRRGFKDGSVRRTLGDPLAVALCLWAFTQGLLQVTATQGADLQKNHGVDPDRLVDFGFTLLKAALSAR